MIITKTFTPRKFIRGVGAALGLPFLDSMVPALTAQERTAAKPVKRLGIVYVLMAFMDNFTPPEEGRNFYHRL